MKTKTKLVANDASKSKKLLKHSNKYKKLETKKLKHDKKTHKIQKLKKNLIKRSYCTIKTDEIDIIRMKKSEEQIANPLIKFMQKCDFMTYKFPGNLGHLMDNKNKPKLDQCTVNTISYQMPEPEPYRFETEYDSDLEIFSSDVSLVESESEEEPFVERKVGEFGLYQIPQGAILLLHPNSKVFFHGVMQVNVLHGTVAILGKLLDKMSPPVATYSPRGTAYLPIENLNIYELREEMMMRSLCKKLITLGLDEEVTAELITYKLKPATVIIHCANVINKATEFLEENLAQKIYPKLCKGLRCTFKNYTTQDWNTLQVDPQWSHLLEVAGNNSKVFLCGGKGVGKSTLLRYLVNSLLNDLEEVHVLDLDPGQPEFTIPGAISIVKVKQPLIGPNYTHLQSTLLTLFVPNINTSADHESYLDCVRDIVRYLPVDVPVIINYMGFTKGIGMFLTASVLSLVEPDIVVQIESHNDNRNFRVNLTCDTIREQLIKNDNNAQMNNYRLFKVDSVVGDISGWEMEPRQVREMLVLCYISPVLPSHCRYLTEKDVKIYQISLNDVSVIFNGKECPLGGANANLVALCLQDGRTCLGWGIVRGICNKSSRLLLITPIDEDILERVKCLVVGSVTLPPALYLRHHDAVRGVIPYTFKGELSNFAKSPKRNRLPKSKAK